MVVFCELGAPFRQCLQRRLQCIQPPNSFREPTGSFTGFNVAGGWRLQQLKRRSALQLFNTIALHLHSEALLHQ